MIGSLLKAVLLASVGVSTLACGLVHRLGSEPEAAHSSAKPAATSPTAEPSSSARHAVLIVVRIGTTDPIAVGKRVGGAGATVQAAWERPNPGPASRRSYFVLVSPDQEQAALARAQADPQVVQAQLIPWPPPSPGAS